jgi:type III secretion protein X
MFDTSIGIQNVLPHDTGAADFPGATPLAATVMSNVGLEDLYLPGNAGRMVEDALRPDVGDGRIVRPDVFAGNLQGCLSSLEDSRNADVRAFVRKDLAPMLEDNSLLQAYVGLMIGG